MHAIELNKLAFRWPGATQATLEIDTLVIARGEKVFLKGASGSGKSTLLALIAGVLRPSSGTISLLGHNIGGLSGAKRDQLRAEHVGFVFQLFNLLPFMTVLENVVLATRFSKSRATRALALDAGAAPSLAHAASVLLSALGLPAALHTCAVSRLSVGQQQRVALARALLGAPELLICDEPTSAIDSAHRDQFMRLLLARVNAKGATLLFVSHDGALEHYFDRTIELAALNGAARPEAVL
jgi:putative ABC transport system ATP-binding protein